MWKRLLPYYYVEYSNIVLLLQEFPHNGHLRTLLKLVDQTESRLYIIPGRDDPGGGREFRELPYWLFLT